MTRSKKLTRQFSKILGSEQAEEELAALATQLKEAGGEERFITLLQNFPTFFNAVEESYEQLDDKVKTAIRNLELSSSELNAVNRQLEKLNASIKAMLEGLGQGLLFFDKDGICSPVFSRKTLDLLQVDPSNRPVWEILGLDGEKTSNFQLLLQMLFSGNLALGFDELVTLAPATFDKVTDRHISLNYRPMYDAAKKLSGILLIATDRTHEVEAERQLQQKEARALRTLRIARNRNYFVRFLQQFNETFNELRDERMCPTSLEQVKRDLHTLKGLAGTFQLLELERSLNDLETDIGRMDRAGKPIHDVVLLVREKYPAIHVPFEASYEIAREILGENFENAGEIVTLPVTQLMRFSEELRKMAAESVPPGKISERFVQELLAVPVHRLLGDFDIQLRELADRFGKQLGQTKFTGEDFPLLPTSYHMLFTSLIHLARNIIDHGIEEPRLREEFGKSREGHVSIHTELLSDKPGWFRLTIADDGGGIDTDILRRKIASNQGKEAADALSEEAVMQSIFEDNMSTKTEVSTLSGRGVGMSAIKAEVERLRGKIWVESEVGVGTRIIMELPLKWDLH